MKGSVLCKRLTGLRLLFIILRSASHVSQIPQPRMKEQNDEDEDETHFLLFLEPPVSLKPLANGL